jgi:hypothetical protein
MKHFYFAESSTFIKRDSMEVISTDTGTTFILNKKVSPAEIKRIVNLIEYEQILSKSKVTSSQLKNLSKEMKDGRWNRLKNRLGGFE